VRRWTPALLTIQWRTKGEYDKIKVMARCKVSFTDTNGIPHDVEVHAESLYEAVALAVSEFRADELTTDVGPMTEFVVAIQRPAVEHRIRLNQVTQWADSTRDGPAGVIKRQRIKTLLDKRSSGPA
jgi:hypothetical protein